MTQPAFPLLLQSREDSIGSKREQTMQSWNVLAIEWHAGDEKAQGLAFHRRVEASPFRAVLLLTNPKQVGAQRFERLRGSFLILGQQHHQPAVADKHTSYRSLGPIIHKMS